jgi:hypothetical protein
MRAIEFDATGEPSALQLVNAPKDLINVLFLRHCGIQSKPLWSWPVSKSSSQARERLVKLARKTGVELRQSYARVGKHALIAHQRYAHAKQFKRANRALRTIRTYLGRVTRDIMRKIKAEAELESVFAHPLMLARRVREQRQQTLGVKTLSSRKVFGESAATACAAGGVNDDNSLARRDWQCRFRRVSTQARSGPRRVFSSFARSCLSAP